MDKKFVYVVDKDSKLVLRQIELAHEVPHLFMIKNGLKEEEMILLEGLGKVHNGQKIKVRKQEVAEVMKSLELSTD